MSSSITTQNIIDHRSSRKASGLVGCITGRPEPEFSPFGYSDVQSWRPADPMNPHCFCFDCRELWDSDGSIDLELIKQGNRMALWTYGQILPADMMPAPEPVPESVASVLLPTRSNGGGIPLTMDSDDGPVPLSLPKPTPRDITNETFEERLRMDLSLLRADIHRDLIITMDKARNLTCMPKSERAEYIANLRDEEDKLWRKLDAIDLLLP